MEPSEEMCKSLAKWLQKIVPTKTRTIPDICDGVAMLDALLQISVEHFSKLEPKIKRDVSSNNWRMKISNLKKVVEAVIEYYQDVHSLQILEIGRPDVTKIGESNDPVQLAKLLRLILAWPSKGSGLCIKHDVSKYLQKNMELEEELSKNNTWKAQCDAYKNQIGELQQKIDEETQRADKAQFNLDKLDSKLVTLQGEKERLILERDSLREENEELKLGPKGESGAAVSQELTPADMEKRLRFLEKENRTLRSSCQEMESKQIQLDSSLNRIEKLQQKNRTLNQNVLKLEAQIEEMKNQQGENQNTSNSSKVKELAQKLQTLQEALTAKENELQIVQAKYTRSVEKAREVAQHLELKTNGDIDSSLRQPNMKEMEERLLTSAYYKLSLNCHREAIDERLSVLGVGQGQSFLARQRQPTPRKQIQRFKSK
nr:protein hook [Leptinotarsa decemlineata]